MTDHSLNGRCSRPRLGMASLAAVLVVASGCGGSSGQEVGKWCDLISETVEIVTSAEGVAAGSDAETELAARLGAVNEELNEIGWPAELSDERELFAKGPQFPGSQEDRELDRAVERSEEFVRRECDLSSDDAELFFGQ